jgi:putative phage-type endonuclease
MIFELEDVTDTLYFDENENDIFHQNNFDNLLEIILHLIDDYSENIDDITDLIYTQFEEEFDIDECDLDDVIQIAFSLKSSFLEGLEGSELYISPLEEKINYLKNIIQPTQRTDEWYIFRHNLITASNAYKAFESQACMNQLIYEKCQPLITNKEVKSVNTSSPMHWGQKYEPISVMIYEDLYKTKVDDFGCIPHKIYKFIGASPDGINVDKNSERYGRMLEIKNVVSREINGIPKKEYWTQMQMQMEVCDLDECDFLETKFIEYENYSEFLEDTKEDDITISRDNKKKGIMIQFVTKSGNPFYSYKPLHIVQKEEIQQWMRETIDKYQDPIGEYNYLFIQIICWKLEVFSCILVLRDKKWFESKIGQLQNIWDIIEKERISGYEHRAPKKKPIKEKETILPTCFFVKKLP